MATVSFLSDIKSDMLIIFVVSTVCLVGAEAESPSKDKCSSVLGNTCLQRCNSTSCSCGPSDGKYAYTECDQVCYDTRCRTLTCSSGTCHQQCHDCKMECTSDVDYCSQQCLSGTCAFKCSARRCVQQCDGKKCDHLPSDHEKPLVSRLYLAILAGLFASTTVLTCLALVLSCSQTGCCRKRTRRRRAVRGLDSSTRSLPIKSNLV